MTLTGLSGPDLLAILGGIIVLLWLLGEARR